MTTSSFFTPTKDEMNAADKTRPVFKADEIVTFKITEIKDTYDKEGRPRLIMGTSIESGEHKGKEFAFFINDNTTSRGIVINMMKAFWSDEDIVAGRGGGIAFIGKTMSSQCKESSKLVNGEAKVYQNFYQFTAVDNTPSIGGTPSTDSHIPF